MASSMPRRYFLTDGGRKCLLLPADPCPVPAMSLCNHVVAVPAPPLPSNDAGPVHPARLQSLRRRRAAMSVHTLLALGRRGEGRSRWRQRPDAPAVLHEWRLGPGRRPGSLDAVRTSKGATPTTPGRSKPCASRRSWSRTWTRRRWRGDEVPRGPQSTSAGA
jgi:hypothetical protein